MVAQVAVADTQSVDDRELRRARRWLWTAFAFFVAGVGVGSEWDRRWHGSHPFEDFWSPPHLFIYANVALAMGTVAYVALSPPLRRAFGQELRWPVAPVPLPGPLAMLAIGLAGIGLAGALDAIWHSTFGLDETAWSLPHALLGHSILFAVWGFVSCRLALQPRQPLIWFSALLLGWALLATAPELIGGPLLKNISPQTLQAISALQVLADDPRAQHTFRIYLAWHVDRTNPLSSLLAAFTVGLGLALLRALLRRDRWVLASAALVTAAPFLGNAQLGWARLWLPLPFLWSALVLAGAQRLGASPRWAWLLAGWACGVWWLAFVPRPGIALLAGPAALAGAWTGSRIAQVIEQPTRRPVLTLAGIVAGLLPALMGALDLYLRAKTP
jgi:hypothetical protein